MQRTESPLRSQPRLLKVVLVRAGQVGSTSALRHSAANLRGFWDELELD